MTFERTREKKQEMNAERFLVSVLHFEFSAFLSKKEKTQAKGLSDFCFTVCLRLKGFGSKLPTPIVRPKNSIMERRKIFFLEGRGGGAKFF